MERARFIRTVIFDSVNSIANVEQKVNHNIEAIRRLGGKVISIVPHNFGISPVTMLYDIVYESMCAFTEDELSKVESENNENGAKK